MYCIFIKVQLKEGAREEYLQVIRQNAVASVRDEPGCHVFDVLEDCEQEQLLYLYEVYDSPEALALHKQTPHYLRDRPRINQLIEQQEVIRANVVLPTPRL
ncbi:putative quinol monooxygenase [Microbulbifer taiwanensis]|uniref:Quinol monooxygenase n=1 Tax=Microbulbifer taiwanensis TaxID=986746 RepID=A0ABW1YKV3_9GAMM|nr:putative quinol monooxygenase [Microbulbifer taiwanensis]